jgi:hypothetical protein
MRVFLKSGAGWLRTGGFWAFVLLALPNCGLNTEGLCFDEPCGDQGSCQGPDCDPEDSIREFQPGTDPVDAVMCEIPTYLDEGDFVCATAEEAADPTIVSLHEAGTALAINRKSAFALDWSDPNACPGGLPKKIEFLAGAFPNGLHLCLNCDTQIPVPYATPAKACVAKCRELMDVTYGDTIKALDKDARCEAAARTATNFDKTVEALGTMCFNDSCTIGGNEVPGFFDPRRLPELVQWTDLTPGLTDNGGSNTLTRTLAASGQNLTDWNEGAQSVQAITKGDAWIDFSSTTIDGAHAIGVRESRTAADLPCVNVADCQDNDPSLDGIGISLDLNHLAQVFVIETVPVFAAPGPFGNPYFAGERFRVHVKDRHDGTAEISYTRIVGQCNEGEECVEEPIYTSTIFPRYPLRVDTSFRDPSTFADVKIVRIK